MSALRRRARGAEGDTVPSTGVSRRGSCGWVCCVLWAPVIGVTEAELGWKGAVGGSSGMAGGGSGRKGEEVAWPEGLAPDRMSDAGVAGEGAGAAAGASQGCSCTALMDRGVQVSVVDFDISAAEAVRRFEDYQRTSCMYLHAHSLLRAASAPGAPAGQPAPGRDVAKTEQPLGGSITGGGASGGGGSSSTSGVTPAYLPFWCFEASYSSEVRAKLGFKDEKTSEMVWKDMEDSLSLSARATASYDDPVMQVYGSYRHVRDVGGAAAGHGLPGRARPLTAAEAEAGSVGGVALGGAAMRQGLAWALAVRGLTQQQVAAAEVAVRAETKATDLRDVHVTLQVHSRSVRLVFLPAYIAVYIYGSRYKQGTSGVIVPHQFTAAIGGTRDGRVVAPQHVSPSKASLGTGGLVGGLGLLAGDMGSWVPGLLESVVPQLGAVEAFTLAVLAASGAGMWAHKRPATLRAHHMAQQVRADYEFYKQYDQHETLGSGAQGTMGLGPDAPRRGGDGSANPEYMLWLWADADWRRWEHDEPWNWDEEERRKWAEDLWRKQAVRRLERQRFVERMAADAARREAEQEAEARRERRYGGSARSSYAHHQPRDHGMGGPGDEAHGDGFGRRRRRSDFLGYYRVLGLQEAEAVSSDDIKAAFKALALQLHPDRHAGADAEAQRAALVKFQKLQIAYDTLKDAEKRRLYDRGQLVQ
ncbi:hypothetical protein GPECTOR_61g826 [Gonium pectorale]|uniref:J domain-containing protein n=1 Tax=Gonium pectorale TaxID=33097 RepID=A0A150G515_GONPE|nr:hypothetical protein GPECTOR_61g826 [Gonium pectorale]|eukprot:KXZ44873.1 hypothetical protein GPECTOR_61g826 [Gonium pectorale]